MGVVRNWSNSQDVITDSQRILFDHSWQYVSVQRANDDSKNVGVTQELDTRITTTNIRARIDPLESKQGTQKWIGLVEPHYLSSVEKGDTWLTQKPNQKLDSYKVTDINADEITLERL